MMRTEFYLVEERLKEVLKHNKIKKHKVLDKMKGKDLVGKSYVSLFDFFKEEEKKPFSPPAPTKPVPGAGHNSEDRHAIAGMRHPSQNRYPQWYPQLTKTLCAQGSGLDIKAFQTMLRPKLFSTNFGALNLAHQDVRGWPECFR